MTVVCLLALAQVDPCDSQGSASEQVGVIFVIDRLIEAPAYNQTQTFGASDFKLC